MRFMVMHKVDASMERNDPPSGDIVKNMGELVQESLKQGIFLNGAGLHRSAVRARLECKGDECTVTRGPYSGKNELVASVAMISARSMDAAIEHARRLAGQYDAIEIEVGPVVEPWDLGLMPQPEGKIPQRFLLLCKANSEDEATGRPEKHRAAITNLAQSLQSDGALLAAELLAPTSQGARLGSEAKGKRTWVDGPFAESKELIAGFSLLELPSKADVIAWANRYAAILGDNEVDVREAYAP
jgi:hypothetical protein